MSTDSAPPVALSEWLTQIWNGDQAVAEDADGDHYYLDDGAATGRFLERITPTAVLARIAADRQILALHVGSHECPGELGWWGPDTNAGDWCPTARLLAVPYAERPGYREEWRPDAP